MTSTFNEVNNTVTARAYLFSFTSCHVSWVFTEVSVPLECAFCASISSKAVSRTPLCMCHWYCSQDCHRDCQPHDTKLISMSSSSSSQPQLYAGNPASSIINSSSSPPALYLLNAAGLAKPHAVQHLAADLASYKCDIAVLTETHFKTLSRLCLHSGLYCHM